MGCYQIRANFLFLFLLFFLTAPCLAPQNSDLDPLPGNPISVHFTSSSFNRAHKQTNKLMLQTQWKPYQKGDAVPKPNLNPPSLEQKASANKCRAAQASTEQRETNQGCCSDALSWGRAIRWSCRGLCRPCCPPLAQHKLFYKRLNIKSPGQAKERKTKTMQREN